MSPSKRPSAWAWIVVHIVFPLVPFLIEGLIRFVVFSDTISWNTFSSPTLAMSSGLLCLFVGQSILSHHPAIPSPEETGSLIGTVHVFLGLAIVFFVLFGTVVLLSALVQRLGHNSASLLTTIRAGFDMFILFGSAVPIISSIIAQQSFKLRTSLWAS